MSQTIKDDEEVQDLIWQVDYSRVRIKAVTKVMIRSLCIFFFLIALTSQFLEGFRWHHYWNSIGKYLLLLTSIPFLISTYLVGQFATAHQLKNDVEKTLRELLEDRYGLNRDQQKQLNLGETK